MAYCYNRMSSRLCQQKWWGMLGSTGLGLWCLMMVLQGSAVMAATPLYGVEFQDIEELSLERLLDITISIAAGRAQKLEEAPGIVSVITAEEMQRLGARTVAEVLKTVPGFEVLTDNLGRDRIVVRGVISGATGGSSENVLVLWNGHRLNQEFEGGATTINLDLRVAHVKWLEIIRGPGSALFGANAFLGVINIVTDKDFKGVEISAGGGSFATQDYYARAGQTFGGLSLTGSVHYTDTQGPQLLLPADAQTTRDQLLAPFGIPPASRTPGTTSDHRRTIEANVQAAYDGLSFNGRIRDEHAGGFIGAQDNLGDSTLDNRQLLFDVSYRYALGRRGSLLGKFGFTQNENARNLELFPPGFIFVPPGGRPITFPAGILFDFTLNSRRFGGEVVLDYEVFARNYLTVGLSLEHEATYGLQTRYNFDAVTGQPLPALQRSPVDFIQDSRRDIFSVYLQDIWYPVPHLSLTVGARYDHYSDFGDTIDPRVGAVWRFAPGFHAKLLYGSAFRAPSFFELSFNVPVARFSGNPNLQPSTSQTVEAALGYTHERWSVGATYFRTWIRNFIVPTNPIDPSQPLTFANSPGINVQGVELEARVHLLGHTGFLNYTYQYPEARGTGERLPDVPSHMANLGVTAELNKYVSLTPTLLLRSARPRVNLDPRGEVPAYGLVNVTLLARHFFRTLELSGTVYNLFDVDYHDPSRLNTVPGDYPRPGRSVFVKATYKF